MDVIPKAPPGSHRPQRCQPARGCELLGTGPPPPLSFPPDRATSTCGSFPRTGGALASCLRQSVLTASAINPAAIITLLGYGQQPWGTTNATSLASCPSMQFWASECSGPHFCRPLEPHLRAYFLSHGRACRDDTQGDENTIPSVLSLWGAVPSNRASLGDRTAWLRRLGMTLPRVAPRGWNPGPEVYRAP